MDKRRSSERSGGDRRGTEKPFRKAIDPNKRVRKFSESEIPPHITGEELEKRVIFQLQSLAAENAEMVAKHIAALEFYLLSGTPEDLEKAYWHGQSATFRAGRLAIVRERAGVAALKCGKFDVALKELKAAHRIAGNPGILPFIATCERALGNPRKALEIAGSIDVTKLTPAEQVELRIAAAKARMDLGQGAAAVVTLTCAELNEKNAPWSQDLRTAYQQALIAAGRSEEAERWRVS